jgi:hypothetical protein
MDIIDLVIADIKAKHDAGAAEKGRPLRPFDGWDSLREAYGEALDLCCYLRTLIAEREGELG